MTLKTGASLTALAIVLSFASPTSAQTTVPGPSSSSPPTRTTEVPKAPVDGQILAQEPNTILSREVVGQTVYAPDKTTIGSISDLIISRDGKTVDGFVIGVGGFLGLGEKSVALKMDRLQMTPEADGGMRLAMDIKKEELSNAPTFKSIREQEAERRAERARSERPSIAVPPGTVPVPPGSAQPKAN